MSRKKPKWDQYWASYRIYSHSKLQHIQNELRPLLPNMYEEIPQENYHITIHPQFQFPVNQEKSQESYLRDLFPNSITITSHSIYFYPSEAKPRVVCLNVNTNIDFEKKQRKHSKQVQKNGGENILDPVNPHITLFSINDSNRNSLYLPSNIDTIYETCDRLESEELPVSFSETELRFQSIREKSYK